VHGYYVNVYANFECVLRFSVNVHALFVNVRALFVNMRAIFESGLTYYVNVCA